MRFIKQLSSAGWWILFGLGTLLLNAWAHHQPGLVERWYSRGLFQAVRCSLDWTFGQLPFPPFYLFWIGVVAFWILAYRRRPALRGFWPKFRFWLVRVLGFIGLLTGLFFWMWGFHYARVPLEQQIGLQLQPLDSTALWAELRFETRALDSLRNALVGHDSLALNDTRFWPPHAEDTVRAAVEKWLAGENFPVGGRVRGRFIYPEGTLFQFGASGIYWPFTGEGNLEAGLRGHALGFNGALKTAVENDIPLRDIAFAQELNGLVRKGDVLLGISTSGNAGNCLMAMSVAKAHGAVAVSLTGPHGGKMAGFADIAIKAPGEKTKVIQEAHIVLWHTMCCLIEAHYFPEMR